MQCPSSCGSSAPMLVSIDAVYPSPIGGEALVTATLVCPACGRRWGGRMEGAMFNDTLGVVEGGRFVAAPFRCPVCEMVSHNPTDIAEGYCGNCHDWTGL